MNNINMWGQQKQKEIIYTEDLIPVRTVYIGGLHPTVTKDALEDFFKKQFNCIESVRFHHNKLRGKPNFAFITFTCAKIAAKAIYSRLQINSKPIRVRAADSWHQPTTTTEIINGVPFNLPKNDNDDDAEFSLLRLNDDCILHLYKFLNLSDIANLSKTCNRFLELLQPIIKRKCENFNLDLYDSNAIINEFTLMDVRTIMSNLGHYIQNLTINGDTLKSTNHSRYLEIIYRSCPNLQELHLQRITLSLSSFGRNRQPIEKPGLSLNNLKKLELHKCDGITDNYLLAKLSRSPNLNDLKIYRCDSINGNFFKSLKKLETINIQQCEQMSLKELKKLLSSNANTLTNVTILRVDYYARIMTTIKELLGGCLKKLTHLNTDIPLYNDSMKLLSGELNDIQTLNISNLITLNGNVPQIIHELSENNKQIVELDISYKSFDGTMENDLIKLETLKVLKVNGIQKMSSIVLIDCAQNMKELSVLSCRKAELSDANVVKIVEFAKNLTELDIVSCKDVTWNVIEKVADVLKKYNDRPKLTLKISYFEDVNYDMVKLDEKHNKYLQLIEVDPYERSPDYEDEDEDEDEDDFMYNDGSDDDYYNLFDSDDDDFRMGLVLNGFGLDRYGFDLNAMDFDSDDASNLYHMGFIN